MLPKSEQGFSDDALNPESPRFAWESRMKTKTIKLINAVYWDDRHDKKVYMSNLRIVLSGPAFVCRQVALRVTDGPRMDFTVAEMDQIAIEYLLQRGIKLPNG